MPEQMPPHNPTNIVVEELDELGAAKRDLEACSGPVALPNKVPFSMTVPRIEKGQIRHEQMT